MTISEHGCAYAYILFHAFSRFRAWASNRNLAPPGEFCRQPFWKAYTEPIGAIQTRLSAKIRRWNKWLPLWAYKYQHDLIMPSNNISKCSLDHKEQKLFCTSNQVNIFDDRT